MSGDTSPPSHVKRASMAAPSAHGRIIVKGAVAIPDGFGAVPAVVKGAPAPSTTVPEAGTVVDVVVVGIASRSALVGGRRVLPSPSSQAAPTVTRTAATASVTIDRADTAGERT